MAVVILILLLAPFLVLLGHLPEWTFTANEELLRVFIFTFWQAAASAAAALVLGLCGAGGLLTVTGRRRGTLETLALLPNLCPVLFMILAVLNFFPGARGFWGIVAIHVALNAGLVAVALARLWTDKIGGMAELAWTEGATRWQFFRQAVLGLLRGELFLLFLFIFAVCFSSFAVPLVIGGSRATTVEVLIYEKVRLTGEWSQAYGIAVLQVVLLFLLSMPLRRPGAAVAARPLRVPLLHWRWGLIAALAPSGLLACGLLVDLPHGWAKLAALPELLAELPRLIFGSVLVGLGTGVMVMFILLLIAYSQPRGFYRRFLISYVAPSAVLTGFSLLIVWPAYGVATLLKIVFGLSLICVPAFYRLNWDGTLQSLKSQWQVAATLGASPALMFRQITLPQVWRPVCFLGGVAAFWAWGDFALSSVVAERSATVALVVRGLLESYRLQEATLLVWLLVVGGSLSFFFFWGLGRVAHYKS